jgi:hypothetical protein
MEKELTDLQAQMGVDGSAARPMGSGVATIVSQEKLIPEKRLANVLARQKTSRG